MSTKSTSPDLSEFFKLSRPKSKPCAIGNVRSSLKPDQLEQLDAALAFDRGVITAAAVREWLAKRGHDVTDAAVSCHRRKVCSCGRS